MRMKDTIPRNLRIPATGHVVRCAEGPRFSDRPRVLNVLNRFRLGPQATEAEPRPFRFSEERDRARDVEQHRGPDPVLRLTRFFLLRNIARLTPSFPPED